MRKGKHYLVSIFIAALLVGLGAAAGMAAPPPKYKTIVITDTVVGQSETSVGANEACSGWNIADFLDLGATNARFYAGMSRLEPEDDDGVYGSPTIAQIKADPNVIPWDTWDYWFKYYDGYFWTGIDRVEVAFYDQLVDCKNNSIRPMIVLRNVDNNMNPLWADELNPPNTPEDWNEWWEFVFAWVYYANVLNNLDVNDWEVHNEPDTSGQGWAGTLEDYVLFTEYTYDAIKYVYDTYLPGESFRLCVPGNAWLREEWISTLWLSNDAIIDVLDWHSYAPPKDGAALAHELIDLYDTDGVHELLYLSEWGHYKTSGYDSVGTALQYAGDQGLMAHNYLGSRVDISSIFSMYNWGPYCEGIVSGQSFEVPHKTETYYAMRLAIRGLQGGRDVYGQDEDYTGSFQKVTNAKAPDGTLWVVLVHSTVKDLDVVLDVSAHVSSGTVTFYQYSETYKDEITGTGNLDNGIISFTIPHHSLILVKIPT